MSSAALCYQGKNRLRYLITCDTPNTTLEIPSIGGATPDLVTDSLAGVIKKIATVKANGYGIIAVGGITTDAQAAALLMSDNAAALVGQRPATLIARLSPRVQGQFANLRAARGSVDGATPSYYITEINGAHSAFTTYLDIEVPGAIGQ